MNKKLFLLGTSLSTCLLAAGILAVASIKANLPLSIVHGDDNPYSITLNRSVTSQEVTAGQASFNTAAGNPILFKFDSSKASVGSGLIDLSTGGVFYNQTKVTGIGRIEGTITGGSATLYYGNDIDCLNVGSQVLDTSGTPFAIDLTSPSDYFKISDVTGPLVINNLKLKFACSNDYAYAVAREVADGDLLYRSTYAWSSGWGDHLHYDMRSFNTIDSTSGYGYHFYSDEQGTGSPYLRITLPNSFDLSHSHIELSGKFKNSKAWVSLKLFDSNLQYVTKEKDAWQMNMDFAGGDYVTFLDWTTKSISNQFLKDSLVNGKNLSDVKYVDIWTNFSTNAGVAKDVYVDALRFVDEAKLDGTAAYNVEMAVWKTGQYYAQGSESEVTYSGTHNSGNASKVTFVNSTDLPAVKTPGSVATANASWGIGATFGTSNGLYAHNLLVEFDVKLSDEFFDSGNNYRHRFQLFFETYGDGAKSPWKNVSDYFDYLSTGSYNFDSNKGKWMHVSLDLSTNSNFNDASNSIGNMRFGFLGLDQTTQQTAWVLIDNLTLSLKA